MSKPRIPRKLDLFNKFICECVDFLLKQAKGFSYTNAVRLNIPDSMMDIVAGLRNDWSNNDHDNPGAYNRHKSPLLKGRKSTMDVQSIKKDFIAAFQPILHIIAASPNITIPDYDIFNIKPRANRYHRKTAVIEDTTSIFTKVIGPGELKILLHTNSNKRPGKGPFADSYEVMMCIVAPRYNGKDFVGKYSHEPPASVDECFWREIHSKAAYIQVFSGIFHGCDVHIYARNYDTRHPELAGPWSSVCIALVP